MAYYIEPSTISFNRLRNKIKMQDESIATATSVFMGGSMAQ